MNNYWLPEELTKRLSELELRITEIPDWCLLPTEKSKLTLKISELKETLKNASDSLLLIGFIGGTGVGKSTIMNALAGEKIASTDHRRPHTENILVYHHCSVPLPEELLIAGLSLEAFEHNVNSVKSLIFCDLPDFDSVKEEHRTTVVTFLKNLDLLVWVVSPEKYADEAFYSFLKEAMKEKNPKNFFFVMNKIDLLDSVGSETQKASQIINSFANYLNAFGIENPIIFSVSAINALSGAHNSPYDQWQLFRNAIYREWTAKEIQAVKEANVEQEIESIVEEIKKVEKTGKQIINLLDSYVDIIKDFEGALDSKVKQLAANCAYHIAYGHKKDVFLSEQFLIGPGSVVNSLLAKLRKVDNKKGLENFRTCLENFKNVFKQLEYRMSSNSFFYELPQEIKSNLSAMWSWELLWEKFMTEAYTYLTGCRPMEPNRGIIFAFKVFQIFIYWGLLVLFFLSMGRPWTFQGLSSLDFWLSVILNCFERLFSLDGFGAIMTFLILEFLAGVYFVSRVRKLLRRLVQKFIETVEHEILNSWKAILEDLIGQIEKKRKEVLNWISYS